MTFSPQDRFNPVWLRLEQYLLKKLADSRGQNDNPKKDAIDTAYLRGRIAAYKEIQALTDEKPQADE
jgi:hypothetical protein